MKITAMHVRAMIPLPCTDQLASCVLCLPMPSPCTSHRLQPPRTMHPRATWQCTGMLLPPQAPHPQAMHPPQGAPLLAKDSRGRCSLPHLSIVTPHTASCCPRPRACRKVRDGVRGEALGMINACLFSACPLWSEQGANADCARNNARQQVPALHLTLPLAHCVPPFQAGTGISHSAQQAPNSCAVALRRFLRLISLDWMVPVS